MADKRNNKPAEVYVNQPAEVYPDRTAQQRNTRTRQPFLTELYPGATPLPDEPQFKDPARIRREMAERENIVVPFTYYANRITNDPNSEVIIENVYNDPRRTLRLNKKIAPYYSSSEKIWRAVTGDNVPTNKEIINTQTGDSTYFDTVVNHYTSIPTADYMRAGLWRFPITQMRDYGEKTALRPIINAQDGDWGAYWDAGINENASTGENRGSIVMFSPNRYAHQLGSDYSHEFNHSMSNPAISSKKYVRSSDSTDIFNHSKKWLIAPSSGLFSPMYGNYDKDGDTYVNAYGENGIRPSLYAARVPATGAADDYAGYLMPDAVPANPVFRRYPVLDGGKSVGYMDRKRGGFWYNYAYNHNEMTQGLIALNRAQHLLQQNIKKNPQAYIDAGVDPAALGQFMQLPTFLKSPAQLDQRMEFYYNHPEFIHLIGLSGPGQIIPRYFMLERERRNGDQSQEWRDYHQDLFNFTRANYFMARNGNNQNPMHTGMGKLYNKLA